jgi:hypothetical protein
MDTLQIAHWMTGSIRSKRIFRTGIRISLVFSSSDFLDLGGAGFVIHHAFEKSVKLVFVYGYVFHSVMLGTAMSSWYSCFILVQGKTQKRAVR